MRSVKEIMRASAVFDEHGRHVNGSDRESNHSYGDAYEALFPVHGDNHEWTDVAYRGKMSKGTNESSFYKCRVCGMYQSDRSVDPHGYPKAPHRDLVKLMMEVGVADGSSLCAWREIFPNALCVGLDIHPSDKAHGPRIEFYLGDQRSKEDCERAAAGRQFDFIVEDATHCLEDNLRTLLYLWPFVRPGGVYAVEEFANIGALRGNIIALWPFAEIVDTVGPFGGVEPLVVFRKG